MTDKQKVVVDVSSLTIVKIVAVLLILGFLYLIRDTLFILFAAIIFTAAIGPWIDWLQKRKISRSLGVILTFLVLLGILTLVVILVVPPLIDQINQLARNFPLYYEKIAGKFTELQQFSEGQSLIGGLQSALQSVGGSLGRATNGVFSALTGLFGGLISLVIILVITFYLSSSKSGIKELLQSLAVPSKYQPYIMQLTTKTQKKLGDWLKGQLILCLIIGVLCYVGLLVLGVKYALVLALIAGLTEIIPYVGPLIAGALAVFVAFVQSPMLALWTAVLYFAIQQAEGHVIVPKVMNKTVGLNPIVIILSVIVGGKLGGIGGALIAIPVVAALSVLAKDFFESRRAMGEKE